jgi:hypothetical protein
MTESEHDAGDFLDQCSGQNFDHSKDLLEGIENETFELSSFTGPPKNKMTAAQFTMVFERQLKTGGEDLHNLHQNLSTMGDDIIDAWSFVGSDGYINVFTNRNSKQVVGAVRTFEPKAD